jgi:DHA2 family multidrug resistance protein-like MFS transporter
MASGTADLQRDLGGAVMQSIFGALLTAGYASAASALVATSGKQVSDSVANQLTKSFDGAEAIAQQYPQDASQITAAAKTSFLQGDQWAYLAGIIAVLVGAAIVSLFFPQVERERELLAQYQAEDVRGIDPGSRQTQAATTSPA